MADETLNHTYSAPEPPRGNHLAEPAKHGGHVVGAPPTEEEKARDKPNSHDVAFGIISQDERHLID